MATLPATYSDDQIRQFVLGQQALNYYPNPQVAAKPWVLFRALEITNKASGPAPTAGGNIGANLLADKNSALTALQSAGTNLRVERVATSIVMPLPPDALSAAYQVSYAETSLGTAVGELANLARNGLSGRALGTSPTDQSAWATIEQVTGTALDMVLSEAQTAIATFDKFSGRGIDDLASAIFRERMNPRTEQLFQKVSFRNFSFSWLFMPQNPQESDQLRDIITIFKYTMLPIYMAGTASTGTILDGAFGYPYEFDILYHADDYLFRPLRCALTDVAVNYAATSDNTLAFLRPDVPGMLPNRPAAISLSLKFQEMQLMTRDQLAVGLTAAQDGTLGDLSGASVGNATLQNQTVSNSQSTRTYRF